MREKIERLAREQFEYKTKDVILSESKICAAIEAGNCLYGSFVVRNSENSSMKGIAYSSNHFLKIKNDNFIGEDNEISYIVNAEKLEPGSSVNGYITLVTDCGEKRIEFNIDVKQAYCESIIGTIKDIDDFKEVARESFGDAVKAFYMPEFRGFLKNTDSHFVKLYDGLLQQTDRYQAVEEFLCAACGKKKLTFTVAKNNIDYELTKESFKDSIVIEKEGWGYAEFKVTSSVSYIEIIDKEFRTDDFASSVYKVEYYVKPEYLKAGRGKAVITVTTGCCSIDIAVTCRKSGMSGRMRLMQKRAEKNIVTNYLDLRLGRKSTLTYAADAAGIVSDIAAWNKQKAANGSENEDKEKKVLLILYRIHTLITAKDITVAKEQLDIVKDDIEELPVELKVVHEYLRMLAYGEGKTERLDVLINIALGRTGLNAGKIRPAKEILMFFIHMYTDESLAVNPAKKLEEIRKFTGESMPSPVILYEAVRIYMDNPYLLRRLTNFDIAAVKFAADNDLYDEELALQLNTLVLREKSYNPLLFEVLAAMYEKYKNPELAGGICAILIRGRRNQAVYFKWYSLGMKEQVKAAELFEYYLSSAAKAGVQTLEPVAYLYYSEYFKGDDRLRAYLYSTLIRQPLVYEHYRKMYEEDIESFILKQLMAEKYSNDLFVLYDWYFGRYGVTEKNAAAMAKLMFVSRITCNNQALKYVTVVHNELETVQTVMLNDSEAYVHIFSEDVIIFAGNNTGERFVKTKECRTEYVNDYRKHALTCFNYAAADTGFLIYLASESFKKDFAGQAIPDNIGIETDRMLINRQEVSRDYLTDKMLGLIGYYYDNSENDMLESYLLVIDLSTLQAAKRALIIEYMIRRELYNIALKAIDEYGYELIDKELLKRLCQRLLLNSDGIEKVDIIIEIAAFIALSDAFAPGEAGEIAAYLTDYYYGSTEDMHKIRCLAAASDIDTFEYDEKLLGQMLFTGNCIDGISDVFMSCYRGNTERKLLKAYAAYCAYTYIAHDVLRDIEYIKETALEENSRICEIAYLKYCSLKVSLNQSEINFSKTMVERLVKSNIMLPYYTRFERYVRLPLRLYDKRFVTYITNPDSKVFISSRNSETEEFRREEMIRSCYGIFVKQFVVFEDEYLEYFIEESEGGEYVKVREGMFKGTEQAIEGCGIDDTLRSGEANEESSMEVSADKTEADESTINTENDFYRINNICRLWNENKESEAIEQISDYRQKDFVNKALFRFMF